MLKQDGGHSPRQQLRANDLLEHMLSITVRSSIIDSPRSNGQAARAAGNGHQSLGNNQDSRHDEGRQSVPGLDI